MHKHIQDYRSYAVIIVALALYASSVLLLIVFLFFQKKLIENILMVLFGVLFLLNTTLIGMSLYEDYEYKRITKIKEERQCPEGEQLFQRDLENGQLYYFVTQSANTDSLETYYDAEVIEVGWDCISFLRPSWECYNAKVEAYLEKSGE